jgi:hypothetical protein
LPSQAAVRRRCSRRPEVAGGPQPAKGATTAGAACRPEALAKWRRRRDGRRGVVASRVRRWRGKTERRWSRRGSGASSHLAFVAAAAKRRAREQVRRMLACCSRGRPGRCARGWLPQRRGRDAETGECRLKGWASSRHRWGWALASRRANGSGRAASGRAG